MVDIGDVNFEGSLNYEGEAQIGFSAYRSTAKVIVDQEWRDAICDTELYDYGNNYNTSSGQFVCPVAGRYIFNGCITLLAMTIGDRVQIAFYKNGTIYRKLCDIGAGRTGNFAFNGSAIMELDVDDSIELFVWQSSGNTLDLNTGQSDTYFSGQKLA